MTSPKFSRIPVRIFLAFILLLFSFRTKVSATQQSGLAAIPSSNSFGTVPVGSSKTATETLSNTGNGKVTVSQVTITGAGFSLSGLNLPIALNSGQSYTFTVQFAPKTSGSVTGNISAVYGHSSTVSVAVSGTGGTAGQLAASPSTLNFGSVAVGSSKSMSAYLSASGASVTVSSATVNSPEFSLSGVSLPFTIAAGKSASFTVKFVPQTSGSASGSLSFKSNATTSTTVEALSGSGTVGTHSVALTWSPESAVSGYNVYRGTKSGGPYSKINSVLDASASFTDTAVQAGYTYYYVTSAVSGSGVESKYSNQVKAVIPTP
jgi:Abnormal spindle-like microcephaly-assoc'd, ASPM-SPD-2-Hydin